MLKLAWRNVLRNRRRTGITSMTIALGGAALLLLGAFMNYTVLEFQTSTVRRSGHLAVFQSGYFLYGAGNPGAYGITKYASVIRRIRNDAVLRPLLEVVSPVQVIAGVAGNYAAGASKTFFGQGVIPADRLRMQSWNEHGIDGIGAASPALARADGVAVGAGLARILMLCVEPAAVACLNLPAIQPGPTAESADPDMLRVSALARAEDGSALDDEASGDMLPRIELLAATASGAPNVMSGAVEQLDRHSTKEYSDNLILMQLEMAQRLAYGRGEPRVTGINIQLRRTEDLPIARVALQRLLREHGLDLEVRDFTELYPLYAQTQAFFDFLFGFIALVIGAIVLFTIMNTMGMSVMERYGEIGTARALGVQRSSLRLLFTTEGALQGLIGVSAGVVLAFVIVMVVNRSGLVWSPPMSVGNVPFKLYLFNRPGLVAGTWLLLILLAAAAALVPAHHAVRMPVVDALRHV